MIEIILSLGTTGHGGREEFARLAAMYDLAWIFMALNVLCYFMSRHYCIGR